MHVDRDKNTKIKTDKLIALNNNPKDVAGAGDCMLVVTLLAYASKASIWESAFLGSLASAIQISRVGNIPLSKHELIENINKSL